MSKPRELFLIILAFFTIYVVWGSTYLFNKIALSEIAPLFLASIRFITAGTLIFIIAKLMGHSLSITRRQFTNCVVASFFFLAYGNGVMVWALKYVDTGFAALEASTQPLVVLVLMRILDNKKIQTKSAIGVVLGIVGICVLVCQGKLTSRDGSIMGMLMIFTCVISWSYSSLFVVKSDMPSNFFINSGYQMVFGGVLLSIASALLGEEWSSPMQWSQPVQVSMILLVVLGSIVAFTAFNYLLKVVSAEKVATSAYVNPIIAMILGWYLLGEVITLQSIIAAFILLVGVYFINSQK